MRSIQSRLTARLVIGVLAITILGSLAVYHVFRGAIVRQFDEGLRAEAHSIASLFRRDHDGHYEFRPPVHIETMFRHGDNFDIYCIRRMDGTVVLKSASLGKHQCPGLTAPTNYHGFHHMIVPGHHHHGRYLRGVYFTFTPLSETGAATEPFQLILAADREETDFLLTGLMTALALVAAVAGAAIFLLVAWTVRRDLTPLRALAQQASRLGAGDLDKRFALENVPRELDPIHRALNGLLGRVEDALKRERRFTADVAHELRTPVAELRSLCEVAIAAADDPKAAAEALADARDIGAQMEGLITVLLELRRAQVAKPLSRVDAAAVARTAWQSAEPVAASCGITMVWHSPPSLDVLCDATMLAGVLRNLFDNAANYTARGGEIEAVIASEAISVRNRPHGLASEDIAHLVEPFWRKDASRSGGGHAGLGLALADAYCRAFGGALSARLEGDWLVFEVRFAAA